MVNVFSFCLYGPPNSRYYPIPMTQNIELVQRHFPDWKVYLYISPDVNLEFLQRVSQYPNVVLKPTGKTGTINRLERLFAIDEPEVETMFVRDADSRVHWKDRWAINDFLSKPEFIAHVIRDNREHHAAMLAGLWGLRKSSGISVKTLFEEYLTYPVDLGFGVNGMDQSFLITYVYPLIKTKLIAHTSNNQQFVGEHNVPFPFPYTDQIHCGKVDGPEFVDTVTIYQTKPNQLSFVNGRFKL